ncbi:DUF924 domain-containing protein [Candidatus Gracilibacteria bacterium]|nr:DUF924 domain-containing protein [Candidatus Gracilibacteria bacterium]
MMPQDILDFWFSEETKSYWFAKSDEFDNKIREKFFTTWQEAAAGELFAWRKTLEGRLAEIIVLDQFSRNLHRNSPLAFSQDSMAVVLSQEIYQQDNFSELPENQRKFALMPLMHSESRKIHEGVMELFKKYTDSITVEFEARHKAIIDRFGRYPYRNTILNRTSTLKEIDFLKEPNSGF